MPRKISEQIKEDLAIAPAQAGARGKTSSGYSMKGYGRARAAAHFQATTGTVAGLHLMQCTDALGAGAKTLSSTAYTTDATTAESKMLELEVEVGEMDLANDYSHLQVKATYGSSNYVSAIIQRGDPSFSPPS